MTVMAKTTNFLKQLTALLTGDEKGVIAAKNERKANVSINSQLASLRAKLVDDQSRVEDRTEAYKKALYPTTLITDNSSYVRGIVAAKEALEEVNATVESTNKTISFFENILKEEFTEIDS